MPAANAARKTTTLLTIPPIVLGGSFLVFFAFNCALEPWLSWFDEPSSLEGAFGLDGVVVGVEDAGTYAAGVLDGALTGIIG